MKTIFLNHGKVSLVSDLDFEMLNKYKWYTHKRSNLYYVVTGGWGKPVYQMHRLILGISDPKIFVDHKDGNTLNNQRCNLRIATRSQNNANRKSHKNSSSQYLGVCWNKKNKNWRVLVSVNKKRIDVGSFKTEKEAALAYNEFASKYHGEFARLNKVPNSDLIKINYNKNIKQSKYIGVSKSNHRWRSSIFYNRLKIELGCFETQEQAAIAYNKKALELKGDKAKLNIIEE